MKKLIIILAILVIANGLWAVLPVYAINYTDSGVKGSPITPSSDAKTGTEFKSSSESFDLGILKAPGQEQKELFSETPVVSLLMRAIDILTMTIGSAALVILVLSGLWLVTSHGEQSQVEKGKKIFTYALVGLGFTFASYIIITFIQSLLK